MKEPIELLARKGSVTVVEHTGGKTIVAIELSCGNILTLEGADKDTLIAELRQMVKNWPDTPASR